MTSRKILFWIIGASLLTVSPAAAQATELDLFCTNQSNPILNPEGDGVMVHAIFFGNANTIKDFHVVHTINRQHYDRNTQYKNLSLNQDSNGFPSYFW
jgi:hypothetical protein